MKLNWKFLGGRGGGEGAKQKLSVGEVWIFSGTAQCIVYDKYLKYKNYKVLQINLN